MGSRARLHFQINHQSCALPRQDRIYLRANGQVVSIPIKDISDFIFNVALKFVCFIKDSITYIFVKVYHMTSYYKHGGDIKQLKLEQDKRLDVCDLPTQWHMDRFFRRMSIWWDGKSATANVNLFKRNLINSHDFITEGIMSINNLIKRHDFPKLTSDEMEVIQMLNKIVIQNTDGLCDKLLLRHIKIFHNVFVKCMNFAIQNKLKDATNISELDELFLSYHGNDRMTAEDKERLKNDENFLNLLRMFKDLSIEQQMQGRLQVFTKYLTGNLLHGLDFDVKYGHIFDLMIKSDEIYRHNVKSLNSLDSQVRRDLAMIDTVVDFGFVDIDLLNTLKGQHMLENVKYGLFCADPVRLQKIKDFVGLFPDIVNKATESINIPLYKALTICREF